MPARTVALLVILFVQNAFAAEPPVQTLFDGKTLRGWSGQEQHWHVADGAITGEIPEGQTLKGNEFLFWDGELHDFDLTAEFRISGHPSANSGIQFRCQQSANGHAAGYQADLDQGATWLGRLYDEGGRGLLVERGTHVAISPAGRRWTDPDPFAQPRDFRDSARPGEWSTYRIRAAAGHVELWVNNVRCAVLDDHQRDAADFSGKLAFQLHGGPGPVRVQFRNIRLTHLGSTSLPEVNVVVPTRQEAATANRKQRVEGGSEIERIGESPALWHLQPNPAPPTAMANPDALRAVASMHLTPGFQAELIAAEPDVHQPIAFAIDERGRLWVAEAFSYPNKRPAGAGLDRITIFDDQNGDGSFETRKVFAEGLNLISGIEVGFGGVWVGAAPELLFIPDRNHDDRPDGEPVVLLDGWGFQDTHETLNSFCWGPDGWLYGNQGVFTKSAIGKPGTPDAKRLSLNAGVWRYHPLRHQFEIYANGGSNQWGLDFNSIGHLFMTHCRSRHGGGGTTYVIRNGHFWNQSNSGHAPFISNTGPDFAPELKNYLPASAKYDSGEGGAGRAGTGVVYGGHSHVGTMIYLGDNWPEIYRDHLFTHNLHGHQINHQVNERQGSAYETFHGGSDLMFTADPAYIAVDLQCGPDGAAYVIDWCDLQHCHNPRDEKWDRTNGRIYRVSWAKTYQPAAVNLAAKTDLELAQLHRHRNDWFARTARRLLQERAAGGAIDSRAVALLRDQYAHASTTADALRAMWTLHATSELKAVDLSAALSHADDLVRAWGVQLGTEQRAATSSSASVETIAKLAQNDPSPTVRLALASALPDLPRNVRWQVAAALANHGEDAADRFLPRMIWFGIAPLAATDWDRAFALAASTPLPSLADSIHWRASHFPEGREKLTQLIARSPDPQALRRIRLLTFGLEREASLPRQAGWPAVVDRFSGNAEAIPIVDQLSAVFGDQDVLAQTRELLADPSATVAVRQQSLNLLKRVGDARAVPIYVTLLDSADFRSAVIPLLARSDDPAVARRLLKIYRDLNEADQQAALNMLTTGERLAIVLLQAIESGELQKQELTAFHIRQMRDLQRPGVTEFVNRIWGKPVESSAEAKARIAQLSKIYSEAPLWAFDSNGGKQVYERACAACHPLDGPGGKLGPNLAGSWRNGAIYFIENIVDPHAVVGEAFRLCVVGRQDGTIVSGLLEQQSETSITIRTVKETITVQRSDIDDFRVTSQSLMPSGILDSLSQVEVIELLKFLSMKK